jgi:perosamine synthetase
VPTQRVLPSRRCLLGLHVLGAGPGDDVIVGDYTFPATGHSVLWTGATPRFADVRPDIWSADPDHVASLVNERRVGILAVDVFGQSADYDELRAIADRNGLWLFEDAACSAGASCRGRPAGSLADLAAFSFHGRKGITAGEGGALVGDRSDWMETARKLHTYGIAPAINREGASDLPIPGFDVAGFNYRMSDLQAAIMQIQLRRLPELSASRARAAASYHELLAGFDAVTVPTALDDRVHAWQSYVITLAPSVDRGRVALALRERGVGCNFGTYASHLQPVYASADRCPVSADLFDRHLALAMHANLSDDDVTYVAEVLGDVLGMANHLSTAADQ